MNRNFIKEFGTIQQYNFRLARNNMRECEANIREAIDDLEDAAPIYDGVDCEPDLAEIYKIVKASKNIMKRARDLEQAANDLDATSRGWFPSDRGEVVKIVGQDPRDWFFDHTSIGDCHDCPLHSGLSDDRDHRHPCGAKRCIIAVLCSLIGIER